MSIRTKRFDFSEASGGDQCFVLGVIGGEEVFPPDMLSSVGIEGSDDRTKKAKRAVIGGTGRYLGATGQVFQQLIALNTSTFWGTSDLAPCWRMTFDLRVLD